MYCSAFQASPLSEKHWDLFFIDMCVCTYMYTSACLLSVFSLVDTYLCWCALVAEQDVLNLEYFRAAPVWAAKQRIVIPWKIHCCFSILLCCLSMPCESTNSNLRTHNDFGIFIPYNTWFIYTAWMRVAFSFHCTPTSLHEWLLRQEEGTGGKLKRLLSIVLPTEYGSLFEESQTKLCHIPVSLQLLETVMPLFCFLWYFCRGMNSKH